MKLRFCVASFWKTAVSRPICATEPVACNTINGTATKPLYDRLLKVAQRKTAQADVKFDDQGRPIEQAEGEVDYGDNVLIVPPAEQAAK